MDKDKKIVPIPENYLELIEDENKIYNQVADRIVHNSIKITKMEEDLEKEKQTRTQFKDQILKSSKNLKAIVDKVFKKLALDKDKDFQWNWTGDKFIGVPRTKEQQKNNKEE